MLKKVDRRISPSRTRRRAGRAVPDQRHHRPDDGGDRRRASDVWRVEPRRQERRPARRRRPAPAPPDVPARRSSRPWSTPCRPAPTGSTSINMTAIALLLATGDGRGDRLDAQRHRLERQVPRRSSRPPRDAARRLPDRRRGGRARRERQARLLGCCRRRSRRRARRRPRLLRLRPAGRPGRGHRASCPTSSARSGSRRCSRRCRPPIHLRRPCHRQGREAVRGDLQGGRRGDHLQEAPTRPIAARATATGSRSNASSARNSSSSAGQSERQAAAASARCCSRSARRRQAASTRARSAPASTPRRSTS